MSCAPYLEALQFWLSLVGDVSSFVFGALAVLSETHKHIETKRKSKGVKADLAPKKTLFGLLKYGPLSRVGKVSLYGLLGALVVTVSSHIVEHFVNECEKEKNVQKEREFSQRGKQLEAEEKRFRNEAHHELFPLTFGGHVSFDYSKLHEEDRTYIEKNINRIVSDASSLRKSGVSVSLNNSTSGKVLNLDDSLRASRRGYIKNYPSGYPDYLKQFIGYLMHSQFPHIELAFYESTKSEAGLQLWLEHFDFVVSIAYDKKLIGFGYTSAKVTYYVDDKSIVSIYSCENGKLRIIADARTSANGKRAIYGMNWIFLLTGPNRSPYHYDLGIANQVFDPKASREIGGEIYEIRGEKLISPSRYPPPIF